MKNLFYKMIASCFVSMAFSMQVSAQSELMNDFMGRPLMIKHYTDVKGSPYLYEEWKEGFVELQNGKAFTGVKLKYDQVRDELLFQNSKGEDQLFVEAVTKFEFENRKFQNGFNAADGTPATAFYEVLNEGSAQLLKRVTKKVLEEATYSSATKVKAITEYQGYYLAVSKDAPLVKLKKDKKSLLQALPGKQAELESYVKEQKLDLRQESDMIKLVTYYNSL